ncbi:MAG: SDR family oxidoreductase, partial [Pseudomonadota bacterium]
MARTVVITGAASGIGRALVEAHTSMQDRVYALDRDGARLNALASPDVMARQVDVADTGALETLGASIWEESGGVDWVYANAGIGSGGALLKATPEQFERCFGVNVVGAWATLQVFAR